MNTIDKFVGSATTEELIAEILRRRDLPGGWQDVDEAYYTTGYALISIDTTDGGQV